MTVATLLLTCLIFLLMGWTGPPYYVTALSIGGIVCIAASNGGTTSQDLKTGFLVGATPKYQQFAILVGALASALILGPILIRLNDSGTVYARRITFAKVDDKRRATCRQTRVPRLPPYTEELKPAQAGRLPAARFATRRVQRSKVWTKASIWSIDVGQNPLQSRAELHT